MSSNNFLPLALFLIICLTLESSPVVSASLRHHLLPHISHIQRTSDVQDTSLIQKACHGVGDSESDCLSTLESAAPHQKNDPNGLAFFTLRFVEDHAANLSFRIKKFAVTPDLPPALQSTLSDCMDQYNPVDDLIEDAINAVLANVYSDAEKFIDAAIANIMACDTQIKSIHFDENSGEESTGMAKDLSESNGFSKKMLFAAFNILRSQ
ncbi:Pectinesterase inhibitor [Dorcoceras hygrometricum]|uniref:Pectinesterase inhibitor n=1 Tax=Dorcoceras hygrometricum TaxID=472368 RepID=A0A2Z7D230_9LAMI|nr:Pectinesterase inhibitor [Dorcoceras hygrometricum]